MKGKRSFSIVIILITAIMLTLNAQAAVKTVKNTLYGELSSREKKNAVLVKNGKSTIRVSEDGYLKFKAPYSGTYTFVFSNQTANEEESNSGSADFYDEAGKMLKIATNGGNTYSANFHSKYRASKNLTKGAYLVADLLN